MRLNAQDGVGVAARLSFSANRSVGVKSELALYIDLPKEKKGAQAAHSTSCRCILLPHANNVRSTYGNGYFHEDC